MSRVYYVSPRNYELFLGISEAFPALASSSADDLALTEAAWVDQAADRQIEKSLVIDGTHAYDVQNNGTIPAWDDAEKDKLLPDISAQGPSFFAVPIGAGNPPVKVSLPAGVWQIYGVREKHTAITQVVYDTVLVRGVTRTTPAWDEPASTVMVPWHWYCDIFAWGPQGVGNPAARGYSFYAPGWAGGPSPNPLLPFIMPPYNAPSGNFPAGQIPGYIPKALLRTVDVNGNVVDRGGENWLNANVFGSGKTVYKWQRPGMPGVPTTGGGFVVKGHEYCDYQPKTIPGVHHPAVTTILSDDTFRQVARTVAGPDTITWELVGLDDQAVTDSTGTINAINRFAVDVSQGPAQPFSPAAAINSQMFGLTVLPQKADLTIDTAGIADPEHTYIVFRASAANGASMISGNRDVKLVTEAASPVPTPNYQHNPYQGWNPPYVDPQTDVIIGDDANEIITFGLWSGESSDQITTDEHAVVSVWDGSTWVPTRDHLGVPDSTDWYNA